MSKRLEDEEEGEMHVSHRNPEDLAGKPVSEHSRSMGKDGQEEQQDQSSPWVFPSPWAFLFPSILTKVPVAPKMSLSSEVEQLDS